MSTIKKPILLDETGKEIAVHVRTQNALLDETSKEIAAHMRTQNALLSAIVRESVGDFASWKDIRAIVRQGLAPMVFNIGDQFIVPWKDVAANKSYDVPLDVVHFGDVELKDGEVVPAMFLQWHYAIPFGVQFDAPENEATRGVFSPDYFYYVADGTGYRLLTPGTDYSIGTVIPATPTYYRSAIKDTSGKICGHGYNRWAHSAIRQFLNSNAGKGAWWVAQHLGDMPPVQLETVAGFMTGFEEDFLSCLSPIKVTTLLNAITDSDIGMTEDTYDTFFLPSLEQMYVRPQLTGIEGDYFEYWKRATGATKPNLPNADQNPGYITYGIEAKMSPQKVRLRSAQRDNSASAWNVYSHGKIHAPYATDTYRCAPVCVVC